MIGTYTGVLADVSEINKLDQERADGLAGTSGSIAYQLDELKTHHHGWEGFFGRAISPNTEIHVADEIGPNVQPFQINAGNLTWGSWVLVLGSNDTPFRAGFQRYDFHKIQICGAQRTTYYFIQIAFGATAAAALAGGFYSSIVFAPQSVQGKPAPVDVMHEPMDASTKAWVRCVCPGQNQGTLDFFVGIHEYSG